MQFIAECGIEYGCQFVTPFSFNSPDCLYTKEKLQILPKLRKKLVKAKRFWKINAIRPVIKAKRGRTWKFSFRLKANLRRIKK